MPMERVEPDVSIRIDDDAHEFHPGDSVSGTVVLKYREPWDVRYLDVVAGWRTEGRGDQNSSAEATQRLFRKGENVSPLMERGFRLRLPVMPWTYYGTYIKLHWIIGVYVKPMRGFESQFELPIIVHPRPEEFAKRR